jgi:hypothetical protein
MYAVICVPQNKERANSIGHGLCALLTAEITLKRLGWGWGVKCVQSNKINLFYIKLVNDNTQHPI